MQAAFFDLDKTVIARAALVALTPPLRRAGYLSRWLVLRALWGHLVFHYLGADEQRMERMRASALRVAAGWDQAHVSRLVEEALEEVVVPIVYAEALELIAEHRRAGRRIYLVSASPAEIVAPLARHLGVDDAIATRARIDDAGRYTGEVEFYAQGPAKAEAIHLEAERFDIDLAESYAYSDSATDLPMLEAVGHPVVVNPDRELLKAARQRDWDIRVFDRPVTMRSAVSMPPASHPATIGGGAVTLAGLMVAGWWLWRRWRPAPPIAVVPTARWATLPTAWATRGPATGIRRRGASSTRRQPGR
ncbi:MAG TPA: HAD-IB family hydrolase [Acidimicrobiales bacterium]|nr:HAD-IB family hydrolase [Acidimicrobiales bacterium]